MPFCFAFCNCTCSNLFQLPGRNTLLLKHAVGFFGQMATRIATAVLEHLRRFHRDTRFAYPIRIIEAELERDGIQVL